MTLTESIQPRRQRLRSALVAPLVFAVLTLVMFADVLVGGSRVLSAGGTDLQLQFLHWRQFGFEQMRGGNLPLWNPHIYGGTPYLAGFQSALLYPPNWLHLVLPLGVAINWIVALHVFAAGCFMYLWARWRELSVGGSILAGVMFMFAGPYFLHIYAGHLPHVCVMVWAPLVLLAIDGLASSGRWRWALVGAAGVAMQVLAGHPQYVYYTAMVAAVYALLMLAVARHRVALVAGFAGIYIGGAMLSAAQLLPGIEATRESVRAAGTSYEFASSFALAPRNVLTLVAPNFFGYLPGDVGVRPADAYWGAGYLWEMSLFVSVTGLVLAAYGAMTVRGDRGRWIAIAMVGITLVLALGRHTPVYRMMYAYVPYYASFRGTVKFAYLAVLFMALLAAGGFDALRRRGGAGWAVIGVVAGGSALAVAAAIGIGMSAERGAEGMWGRYLAGFERAYETSHEMLTRRVGEFQDAETIRATGRAAARSLLMAAATGAMLAGGLWAARRSPRASIALLVLAMIELFIFARSTRATMTLGEGFPDSGNAQLAGIYRAWEQAIAQLPPGMRVLSGHPQLANYAMSMGYHDMWGYDPLVLRRYAELMFASQRLDPDDASQNLPLRMPPASALGVLRMLRCAYILAPDPNNPVLQVPDPLPVAVIVPGWVELPHRDSIFAFMLRQDFEPRRVAVLESPPPVIRSGAATARGEVRLVGSGTDWLEARVTLEAPALLLITQNLAHGWRARSLRGDPPQAEYPLIRANYVLPAIPLMAGEHHLRIEYAPASFRIGAWLSLVSLMVYGACGAVLLYGRRPSAGDESSAETPA